MGAVTLTVDETGAVGVRPVFTVTPTGLTDTDADRLIAEARRICAYHYAMKQVIEPGITRA